jgi:hypothetical protein
MFLCPIHHSSQFEEITISCHVDSWDERYCSACLYRKSKLDILDKWFRNSTSKFPTNLKKLMKVSQLDFYSVHIFFSFYKEELQNYTCYRYLNDEITRIHIYDTVFNRRMSIESQRYIEYVDLPIEGKLPIELATNDSYLNEVLYSELVN